MITTFAILYAAAMLTWGAVELILLARRDRAIENRK